MIFIHFVNLLADFCRQLRFCFGISFQVSPFLSVSRVLQFHTVFRVIRGAMEFRLSGPLVPASDCFVGGRVKMKSHGSFTWQGVFHHVDSHAVVDVQQNVLKMSVQGCFREMSYFGVK